MIFTAILGTSPCSRRQTLLLRLGVLGYQVGDSRLMGVGFRGGMVAFIVVVVEPRASVSAYL